MSALRSAITALAVLLLAAPLIAQNPAMNRDTTALTPLAVSALVTTPSIAIDRGPTASKPLWMKSRADTVHHSPIAAVRSLSDDPHTAGTAMMMVGGAGLLVGAIVGGKAGTTIMVGGGLLGLMGLWNYLK